MGDGWRSQKNQVLGVSDVIGVVGIRHESGGVQRRDDEDPSLWDDALFIPDLPSPGNLSSTDRIYLGIIPVFPLAIFPAHQSHHAVHSIPSNLPEQLHCVVRRFWCIGSFVLVTYLMTLSCFHKDFIANSYYPAIFPHFPAITPRFLPF